MSGEAVGASSTSMKVFLTTNGLGKDPIGPLQIATINVDGAIVV